MAKQIYIDENGNPIEVSGTINTAELLPISGNDPTDTKTYIDTGLSGKAKKTWTDLGNKSSGDTVNVSGYSEVLVWGNVGGGNYYNSLYIDLATLGNSPIYFSIYQSASYNSVWKLTISANTFTLLEESYQGWGSRQLRFMVR